MLSDLKGHGSVVNGIATLTNISFSMPGAKARMHGTYGLIDYKVDLDGTLLTTGNPSDATTGFKAFMVKVITPLFKKKHSAKLVAVQNYGIIFEGEYVARSRARQIDGSRSTARSI